ncbi:TlpA family protein disulfide reductase [Aestuariibaculum sp. M13]|uniref:TlpA family protein disulfide reductase n=1 Tax=Aestuariibaculum sp. M13 TaxID=2967132 RepID=UPI002159C93E|nr:TlpA disulfide reductase family protein [Aestuariibaculum sp. M13]MCR8668736.1 TlpA family protein disulfide reductase [Aestuariibaculum sp. M13]
MRYLFFIALIFSVFSCINEQPPKDYVVVHGTIANPIDSLDLRLFNPKENKTVMIDVDTDGRFRDTLKLENPANFTAVYKSAFNLYLANDMDIQLQLDAENISESLVFSGKGQAENNFLKFKLKGLNKLYGNDYKTYFSLNQEDFDAKTNNYLNAFKSELEANKAALDSVFINRQKREMVVFQEQNLSQYNEQQKINKALAKGNRSPEFNDYVNYAGGASSLKDYRGSYVYIDVWATWCGPCKYEIPYLEKVEKKYHDKNIKFVSISIDTKKDEQKWRDMIEAKNMGGIQLLADNDYNSQFVKDYYIYGIPRFILLDPEGNIVNYDAPRPSEDKLDVLFASLDI